MNKGWVKIYRKTLDNEMWKHDHTAWKVFEYFLLTVDKDSGKRTFGRFQVADCLGVNPSTLYKALQRLKSAKMVTLKSNNRFTTIYILKWHSYQGNGNTSGEQPSNNQVTLNKNRELRNTNTVLPERVKAVLEELGDDTLTPTKRFVDLIEKDFGRYKIMSSIKALADYNDENNRAAGTRSTREWLQNDLKWGKLEVRDK